MSDTVLLKRDRYDPHTLLSQLAAQVPGKDVDQWCYLFKCGDPDTDDFVAYLPDDAGEHENARCRLAEFLRQIREIDNSVQTTFEAEYHASGLDLRGFKLAIGWLSVLDGAITVRYWGTVVNTEWEITLTRSETGQWIDRSPAGTSALYPGIRRPRHAGAVSRVRDGGPRGAEHVTEDPSNPVALDYAAPERPRRWRWVAIIVAVAVALVHWLALGLIPRGRLASALLLPLFIIDGFYPLASVTYRSPLFFLLFSLNSLVYGVVVAALVVLVRRVLQGTSVHR